jgi:hypothetical protein
MNSPGKGLLKVASILLIIFGAIAAVILFIGLIVYVMNVSLFGELAGIIIVTIILILIVSVLELILGIIGLKKFGDLAKGGFFITTGTILCALSLVSLILSISGGSFNVTILGIPTGTLTFIGFVLPVLYIIGGSMYKKAVL